ncbi:chromosome segregation in meiosis- protein [Basidiobolus ranarum]|uniref:Chromosome segregation in meiosis protein n=1 Tax=Basidiobolus ranarum TaxID=34480 RepID=A0ABR2W1C2_9FUNG
MYIKEKGPKLKFKGKGQEFEDLRHLLDFYQLWCHQLFPKMRFPDAIKKIEKLCSERRLKVFREELIKAERENRGIASGVQIQIDNNRPDTITDWNFGDHEEVDAPMVIQSDEETQSPVADMEDGLQFTGSNGDIEADQLRRIRENRERALARLAARKRARTIEREEEEEEARKIQRAEEVSDLPNSELHETEPEEQESVE